MQNKTIAAAALLAVATTGVVTATANAAPAPAPHTRISYTSAWAPDHSTLTATVRAGRFAVTPRSVEILADNGAVPAQLPTVYSGVVLEPQLNAAATTLTPRSDRPIVHQARDISLGGTIGGTAIGCLAGGLIGVIFLVIGVVPGCLIGCLIGGVIGSSH